VDGNRIDMRKGILSMGVQIYEDRGSPTAPYIGGANVIRDNAIRNTKFECIIITGSSLNTVLSNTLDTCVDGVTVQGWSGDGEPRVVTGNVVRNNRITNAGGPEYVSGVPPFPDGERYGHGVHIYFQAIATTVVGNVITDMRKDGGSGSHRHGIKLASTSATADTGNVVLANTVSWTTRSPHGATRGIMSVAPRTLINFNVVKNAPQAIQVGQSTTEVKGNYVLNNGAAVSWQTAPASGWPFACNRMVNTGTSNYAQGTCVISSSGNPTTAMSTTLANPASYYSDVDCKGVEHVLASLPNSWNTTGVRRTTAVSNQWAGSRRDAGGNCSNSAPGYISSYPVYR